MTINNFQSLGKAMGYELNNFEPKRGEIYYVDLSDMGVGTIHITQKKRPALIIQNNIGNKYSTTIIVALITSSIQKKDYPMHYSFNLNDKSSIIMFEQIMTLDKNRIIDEKIGELTPRQMSEADNVLMYSLQLNRLSLQNVQDIDIISQNTTKSKQGTFVSFDIDIIFTSGEKQQVNILLNKLKEFDNSIDSEIDFDDLKKKLDNCKGLNWLVNNNAI